MQRPVVTRGTPRPIARPAHLAWTLGLAALLAPAVGAAERSDPIEKVVVFGDRAQVTRKATVACEGGQARAVFFPLTEVLQPRTLRGAADGSATAVGTTARQVNVDVADDARLGPLRAEIEALLTQIRETQDDIALNTSQAADAQEFRAHLAELMNEGLRAEKPTRDRWAKALDALKREALARTDARRALDERLADQEKTLADLNERLSQLQAGSGDAAWRAEVAVDCKGAARATVRLSYIVPGATWKPEYDLRFEVAKGQRTGRGTAEVRMGAVIQQATGEDWTDVTLVLSSARPWLGVEAPEPRPLRVYGNKGSDQKVLVQAQEKRERAQAGGPVASGGPSGAELNDKGQSVTLTLPHAVTIAADGRPYWAPVDSRSTPAEVKLIAVPKKTTYVYQVVAFKNPTPYPLMAGRVHTWRNGTFVGDTWLEHTGPGAPVEASLGIDEAFRAERAVIEDSTRDPGFLSSTRTLPRAYTLTLKSRTRQATTIELRENIPVSKVDDIKVNILANKTTKGYDRDALTGLLTWPVKLAGNGTETVKLGYSIKLPDDWKVQ